MMNKYHEVQNARSEEGFLAVEVDGHDRRIASCSDGEAKFWLEPQLELARNYPLSRAQIREAEAIIEEHEDELKAAWGAHFPG